jgi:hypothetical protein
VDDGESKKNRLKEDPLPQDSGLSWERPITTLRGARAGCPIVSYNASGKGACRTIADTIWSHKRGLIPCGGLERRLDKSSSKDPEQLNYGDFHKDTFRRAFSKYFH